LLSNRAITNCDDCVLGRAAGLERCHFGPITRQAGELICGQGQHTSAVYFLKAGLVSLSVLSPRGTEPILMLRGPSSLLCIEALRGQPSRYQVRAISRVRLCGLAAEQMTEWIGPDHSPARAVLDLMLQEDQLQHMEINMREGPCLSRVARFALTYSSFLEERPDAVRKRLLAKTLGMRQETFSRCLTKLEQCGAIDASQGVRVRDSRRLSEVASG
jgi:CRP-like cAMP-binding protein